MTIVSCHVNKGEESTTFPIAVEKMGKGHNRVKHCFANKPHELCEDPCYFYSKATNNVVKTYVELVASL